jgi:hypothetical protein
MAVIIFLIIAVLGLAVLSALFDGDSGNCTCGGTGTRLDGGSCNNNPPCKPGM